jgi:hypothetical protein
MRAVVPSGRRTRERSWIDSWEWGPERAAPSAGGSRNAGVPSRGRVSAPVAGSATIEVGSGERREVANAGIGMGPGDEAGARVVIGLARGGPRPEVTRPSRPGIRVLCCSLGR